MYMLHQFLRIALMNPKLCFTWQNSQRIISNFGLQQAQVVQLGLEPVWQQPPKMNTAQLDRVSKSAIGVNKKYMCSMVQNKSAGLVLLYFVSIHTHARTTAFFTVSSSLAGTLLRFFFSPGFSSPGCSTGSSTLLSFFSFVSNSILAGFSWQKNSKGLNYCWVWLRWKNHIFEVLEIFTFLT